MKNFLLISVLLTLVACSPSGSTTRISPSQPQPVVPTSTLSPAIASTSTDSPIFATLTAIAMLPTKTSIPPTPTFSTETNRGGVLIAKGNSQLILFGRGTGTGVEEVHVVNDETFAKVITQQGVQMALSGGGPPLFAYFADQPFTSSGGGAALADISVGSTDDPNVSIGFMWSSEINGAFPASEVTTLREELFSVQGEQSVEIEGWLEFGQIWTSNSNLSAGDQQESFSFFLFHQNGDIYLLGFLPNYETVLPVEDPTSPSGQDHAYLVRGFVGGSVTLPLNMMMSPIPILQINYIERQK
jgi:hypothetical protein